MLKLVEQAEGYRQVGDAYLVALARHNRATLHTFDQRIGQRYGSQPDIEVLA